MTFIIKSALEPETPPTVLGFGAAVVILGSMEPEISLYALVIIHEKDSYEEGDAVIFKSTTSCVTHRIVGIETDENGNTLVTTKGDANNAPGSPIPLESVVGKVILTVPKVGYVQNFLQTPAGFLLLTLAAGFFLLAPEWIARKKASSTAKAAPSPEGKAINSSSAAKAAPSPKGKDINQKKGR